MTATYRVTVRSTSCKADNIDDGWTRLSVLISAALPFILAAGPPLHSSLTVGMAACLALAPAWLRAVREAWGVGVLGLGLGLSLITSPILAEWTKTTHRGDSQAFTAAMLTLIGVSAGAGALVWCQRWWHAGVVSALFGLGMLVQTVLHRTEGFAQNPWKFGYAMPITLILLGVCGLIDRLWLTMSAVGGLAAVSALNDGRSASALLLMTAILLGWQHRPQFKRQASSTAGAVLFLGLLAFSVYRSLQAAILDGYLGSAVQQRTQAQVEQSGSLILGGRPEAGASWALFRARPIGFGPGIVPNLHDIMTAKAGMASLGYDPDNGYVERYMLGQGHFEMHSMGSDLWATYGLAGLILAVAIAVLMLHYVGRSLAFRAGSAVGLFLAVRILWDICFSPVPSTMDYLTIAVALTLLPRKSERSEVSADVSVGAHRPVASA